MKLMWLMLIAALVLAVPPQSADVRFRAAQQKETVEGDLRAAIQLYHEVAADKEASRGIAAQALLRVGRCYEKLGSAESKKAYERVLREYADQAPAVNEARSRLASHPAGATTLKPGEIAARLLFRVAERSRPRSAENIATDGRSVFHFVVADPSDVTGSAESLVATDIATGNQRTLFRGKFWPFGLALSSDGRELAFSHLDLSSTANPMSAKWSVYVVGTDGSNPRAVFTDSKLGLGRQMLVVRTWSPNGDELAFTTAGGGSSSMPDFEQNLQLKLLSLKDGSVRVWKDFGPSGVFQRTATLSFSPDGQYLAYDFPDPKQPEKRNIFTLARTREEPFLVVGGPGDSKVLGWTPNGNHLLFASDRRGTVDAHRISMKSGKSAGPPELVKPSIGSVRPVGFRPNGSFYYISDASTRTIWTAAVDSRTGTVSGEPRLLTEQFVDDVFTPEWSPDGMTLAYSTNRNLISRTAPVLILRDMRTGRERTVSLSPVAGSIRVGSGWSPNSRYLYVDGYEPNGMAATFQVTVESGEVKRVAPGMCHQPLTNDILLCFERTQARRMAGLWKLNLTTGERSFFKEVPDSLIASPRSPDGRFLLYSPAGSKSIRMFPIGDGDERDLVRARSDELLWPIDWVGEESIAFQRLRSGQISYWLFNMSRGSEVEIRGADLSRLLRHSSGAYLRFHPNGGEAVWVSDQGKNELWVLENPTTPLTPARTEANR